MFVRCEELGGGRVCIEDSADIRPFVLLIFAHIHARATYLCHFPLLSYFRTPFYLASVGRAGQLNYPKSRYYSWEIIDHRPIAFVTIDYSSLDSDYNTTTPKLFRLVHNTFLCLILITLNSVRSIVLLLLYSCEYNHPRTLTSASSWYILDPNILFRRTPSTPGRITFSPIEKASKKPCRDTRFGGL